MIRSERIAEVIQRGAAMQCPTCKQMLEDGIRFCPHDGTPLIDTSATRTDVTPTGRTCEGTTTPQGVRKQGQDLELPVVVGGRYRLEEVRGGGGMAKVYRAFDLTLEREVAVKLINPELRSEPEFDIRFQREARIASQLADPHIVVVHDFDIDSTHGPYLVMEFLQGQSLRERINSMGALPLKAGLQLAGQLFLALIHAHGKGIVHRDIKPDNIFLLNVSGVKLHVRVLDFGIARIYRGDDTGKTETITHAGAVLGTPRYMSPEQLAGQPVDARSDIYSAALVLFEALTGQLPYLHGKKLRELCPEATQEFQDLLAQCLAPSPDERPPTAVEVYLRLQELGKASGVLLLPPGAMDRLVAARKASEPTIAYVPPRNNRSRRRILLLGVAAALLVLTAIALGRWFFFPPAGAGDGPENLHGIAIGDSKEAVEQQLGLARESSGRNPWKNPTTRPHLGQLLRPEDLQLEPGQLNDLVVGWTPDERITVLFHEDRVVAVVTSHRWARSARGVRMQGDVGPIFTLYRGLRAEHDETTTDRGQVEMRRYPTLGIGFEVQGGRVTGMALYPPVP